MQSDHGDRTWHHCRRWLEECESVGRVHMTVSCATANRGLLGPDGSPIGLHVGGSFSPLRAPMMVKSRRNDGTNIHCILGTVHAAWHSRLKCVLELLTAHPANGCCLLHFLLSRSFQPLMGCADKFRHLSTAHAHHILSVQNRFALRHDHAIFLNVSKINAVARGPLQQPRFNFVSQT